MKLISCYIENFGAIRKESLNFSAGLTSVCKENGYGKSTLAAFLKAMFYGMDSDRANSKDFGDRRHFNPFEGGLFGGNVVFSTGKDVYKIERYFDEKSEIKDSLTVYKNNEKYTAFGTQIGEKIFGIDKESFERTVFIDAKLIEIGSTGSINAKLNRFVEGSTDENNCELALERLEKAAKEYKKSRTGNDLITKENDKLIRLRAAIENITNIQKSLPDKYDELAGLSEDLKQLQQQYDAMQQTALLLKDWEQYDSLAAGAKSAEQAGDDIRMRYPNGIPSAEEIAAARDALAAKSTLQEQTGKELSQEDAEALAAFERKYADGAPSEQELARVAEQIGALTAAEAELRSEENGTTTEYERALREAFAGDPPTEQTLLALDAACAEYERAEQAYAATPDYTLAATAGKGGKKPYVVAAILAAIIAAAGIGVLFVALIPGIAMLAAGAVCLLGVGFLYLNKKSANAQGAVQTLNPAKTERERDVAAAEARIERLLARYGYTSEKSVRYAAEKFKNDFADFTKLAASDAARGQRLEKLRARRDGLRQDLQEYFARYGFADKAPDALLTDLRNEIGTYRALSQAKAKLQQQNAGMAKNIAAQELSLRELCDKYALSGDVRGAIERAARDLAAYAQARSEYAMFTQKAEAFKAEKHLAQRPADTDEQAVQEMKSAIAQLSNERNALAAEISDCETDAEKLDDLLLEEERHRTKLQEYRRDHGILTTTIDLLRQADKQLKDQYIAPVKNNYLQLAALLEKAIGERVTMTPNFEIRFERNGIERSEQHLSAGQRSLCAFCFRMALIENMYADEKPFLILDDPFVNLDGVHLDRVKEILKTLSERLQIIYFTCHESRAV